MVSLLLNLKRWREMRSDSFSSGNTSAAREGTEGSAPPSSRAVARCVLTSVRRLDSCNYAHQRLVRARCAADRRGVPPVDVVDLQDLRDAQLQAAVLEVALLRQLARVLDLVEFDERTVMRCDPCARCPADERTGLKDA